MKYLVAILALVVILLVLDRRKRVWIESTPLPTTAAVRDSAQADSIRIDTVLIPRIRWLRQAPVDTLALILRDRARRPVVLAGDTLLPAQGMDTIAPADGIADTACLSQEVLASTVARQLADSGQHVLDQGRIRVQDAVIDSLDTHLDQCLDAQPRFGFRTGFGAGYIAGIATCVLIK